MQATQVTFPTAQSPTLFEQHHAMHNLPNDVFRIHLKEAIALHFYHDSLSDEAVAS
jgi:hypothetical protein